MFCFHDVAVMVGGLNKGIDNINKVSIKIKQAGGARGIRYRVYWFDSERIASDVFAI